MLQPNATYRERIIDAGMRLFQMNGYMSTAVQDITSLASVPKGSFYNHFQSKEKLALEIIDEYEKHIVNNYDSFLRDKRKPPIDRIYLYFERINHDYSEYGVETGCLLGNLSLEVGGTHLLFRERLRSVFSRRARALESVLEEATEEGWVNRSEIPLNILAHQIIDTWEGATMRCKISMMTDSHDQFLRYMLPQLIGHPSEV
ncbi:TPA: TetR/AcrR family transcriptional regulator [Pseudomonas aeruginosa]